MHRLLWKPELYQTLLAIDESQAREHHGRECPHCGAGVLHQAHYPRAPRGGPPALPEAYSFRHSFSCSACRLRVTPPSVRFLGRRWYLGPFVVVLSALMHGPDRRRVQAVREAFGDRVSWTTLRRWRRWWLEHFPSTRTWQAGRGGFVSVSLARLPVSLLEAFLGSVDERLCAALRFLSPLTTSSSPGILMGPARR